MAHEVMAERLTQEKKGEPGTVLYSFSKGDIIGASAFDDDTIDNWLQSGKLKETTKKITATKGKSDGGNT